MDDCGVGRGAQAVAEIICRRGTSADSYAVFCLFEETFADLTRRMGSHEPTSIEDPAALAEMWKERESLYLHLAETAEHFWIAEYEQRIVGFARSILRGGVRLLTEFFVLPGTQSSGVGGELLARAFPVAGATHRLIVASLDVRAQARYLKAGLVPHFPIYYFGRTPEPVDIPGDLIYEPLETTSPTLATLETLGMIDEALLGHRRGADHRWLLTNRQGYLYRRGEQVVGYGYAGQRSGPFALLDAGDFPAVLSHAEAMVAEQGHGHFGLEVPMVNRAAVDHLLGRGFQIDWFMAVLMCDQLPGTFERYILTSPPFIL
jgi:GNAT superfamily N-acetyltransferase